MRSTRTAATATVAALVATSLAAACGSQTVRPAAPATTDVPSASRFPHGLFGLVLSKVVDARGLVDYKALAANPKPLDDYLAELARVSPASHKHLFPTEVDQLTYYLNAHNACALAAILKLGAPKDLAPVASRLDNGTLFLIGGKERSLLGIVSILRDRFPDPRVHFVLVRGRRGGPPLSANAFEPATVDEELEKAARAFTNDPRHVKVSLDSTSVGLSRLFFDFRDDFERQAPATVTGAQRLLSVIGHFRGRDARLVGLDISALPFDERLNAADVP